MMIISNFFAHVLQVKQLLLEVNDYHLIFNLNGILIAMGEGQTRTHSMVLRLGLKEFLFACVKNILCTYAP
jgi:hypothetical protein